MNCQFDVFRKRIGVKSLIIFVIDGIFWIYIKFGL